MAIVTAALVLFAIVALGFFRGKDALETNDPCATARRIIRAAEREQTRTRMQGSNASAPEPGQTVGAGRVAGGWPMGAPLDESFIVSPGPLWTVSETDTFVTSSLKMRQESAQWREALEKHRFIRGAEVLWQRGADPSAAELAREAVLEFRSAADAAAFDEWDANRSCRTIAVFAVPPISNAIGYRFDAAGEDRAIEEVSFLAGNRIYSVLLNTSSVAPVRQELMALVGRAVFRASSSGPGCDRLPGMVEDARFWATRRMPPDISPRKLAQIRPPSGFLAGQESRAPSPNPIDPSRPGPGWFRSWEDGPSQIRLNVFRFATTDASLQWVSGAAVLRCRETVPTVSTDYDVPGSIVMVRLSPSNIVKDVFIVRGRVGYMVDFLGPVSEDPRSLLRPFLLRLEARNTQT